MKEKKEKNIWCEWFINYTLYTIGKKFYCTYSKTTAWDDIILCKPFNGENMWNLVKICKKEKTCERFFITFNWWYENKEKIQICFVGIKTLSNSQNTTIFIQQACSSVTFL